MHIACLLMVVWWNEMTRRHVYSSFFFFNDTATTEIYTLSLHDALPIFVLSDQLPVIALVSRYLTNKLIGRGPLKKRRSEEHTSELQSHLNLVCRLLL